MISYERAQSGGEFENTKKIERIRTKISQWSKMASHSNKNIVKCSSKFENSRGNRLQNSIIIFYK